MEELDILLSEEFAEFSRKITGISEERKAIKETFEATYATFKENMKSLEKEALKIKQEFDNWKSQKAK